MVKGGEQFARLHLMLDGVELGVGDQQWQLRRVDMGYGRHGWILACVRSKMRLVARIRPGDSKSHSSHKVELCVVDPKDQHGSCSAQSAFGVKALHQHGGSDVGSTGRLTDQHNALGIATIFSGMRLRLAYGQHHALRPGWPELLGPESVGSHESHNAIARQEVVDIVPIGLVPTDESASVQEDHRRQFLRQTGIWRIDIELLSFVRAIGQVVRTAPPIAWLLCQQGAMQLGYGGRIDHLAKGAQLLREFGAWAGQALCMDKACQQTGSNDAGVQESANQH
jgi:hypothetical protein